MCTGSCLPQAEAAVDEFGELAIKCLRSQGLAAVSHLTIGLDSVPVKRRGDAKKALTKQAEEQFPDSKVLHMEGSKDAAAVLWCVLSLSLSLPPPAPLLRKSRHQKAE